MEKQHFCCAPRQCARFCPPCTPPLLPLHSHHHPPLQITAHVREKLHCAAREHAELEGRAEQREAAMAAGRTELAAARTARDRLRRERDSLADDWSIVSDRRCLQDMGVQRERLAALQAEAAALKARCAALQGQAHYG